MLYLDKSEYGLVGWLKTPAQVQDEESEPEVGKRSRELMTMPYTEYLQTPEWDVTRKKALKAAGYRCTLCNAGGELHVHHRTYERRGVELLQDLTVLCAKCHQKFHETSPDSYTEQAG